MKVDFDKVGTIAAYFAQNTKDLYVTKLLKLFYYLDFVAFNKRGAAITNDVYFKLPYGPVPSAIKNEIDLLSAGNIFGKEFKPQLAGYINLKLDADGNGNRIVSVTKDLNLRKLSNFELELMKSIATRFKDTKAKALSNQTHKEKPWLSTSDNSVIDYALAADLNVSKILSA